MSDTTEPFDLEQYRANTRDLVDSIGRTTDLMEEMGDNVTRLGDCFDSFGESGRALRDAREARNGPTATAATSHAAD